MIYGMRGVVEWLIQHEANCNALLTNMHMIHSCHPIIKTMFNTHDLSWFHVNFIASLHVKVTLCNCTAHVCLYLNTPEHANWRYLSDKCIFYKTAFLHYCIPASRLSCESCAFSLVSSERNLLCSTYTHVEEIPI